MTVPSLAVGTIVAGRYTVHAVLGRRAGRVTYHCITAPNRHVAVKLLDPALAQTDAQAALAMATAAASELPEGAVLHVLDRGIDPETGAPFFVSSLSDHPSLEAFVSLCPLSLTEMATMARSLARGLDTAHRRGLAHLALRPTNVFVGPPPACWTRTADFGAGAIDRAIGQLDRETLAFAAPELYAGEPGPLSAEGAARADVFSAALLCFYAAAGDTYWKATRRRGGATPGKDLGPLVLEASGKRAPASVAAREIGATWNPALDAAFARALSSAPAARYGSVGELADAFAEALGMPRLGGAPGLADSLVKGDPAPQTVRLDDDDEPATRMVTAAPPAGRRDPGFSVGPPPESIAPVDPRSVGPRGLGGTMIMESTAPPTSPSTALSSVVPPPAALPAFGASSGSYPLPAPYPTSMGPGAPVAEAPATASRSRVGLILVALTAAAIVAAAATVMALRGGVTRPPVASTTPASPTTAAASARPTVTRAPSSTPSVASATRPASAAPSAIAAPAATGEPATTGEPVGSATPPATPSEPEGPIPTTYGQQPKPKVDQLDPPTTWYAELVVLCEPACELVLVQGGPTTNHELPKQVPPGTYIVTVRQSGGIQSQASVLRAATRTTLLFDGRLAIPEKR